MSTGISSLDDAIGGLENGKRYCIACSSLLNRLPLLAEVAIGLLSTGTKLAIVSIENEQKKLVEELKSCYRAFGKSSGALTLWAEYQPSTSYKKLRSTIERIIKKDRNLLHVFVVDNLLKIETDFPCPSPALSVAANLYLLKMLAVEYDIPVIAFSELNPEQSLCATFADSEDIQKLVVYRVQKERLPRPIREDAVVLSTTTRRYHSGEKELPLMVARV